MSQKERFIRDVIKDPLSVRHSDFDAVANPQSEDRITFPELRGMLKRVFNLTEEALLEESDATTGMMGRFNRFMTGRRQKMYYRKVSRGFVQPGSGNKLVVAEGDSWFQFIGKDIIGWLKEKPEYAIYSMSYGGGWLSNILLKEKYVEELSIHKPSAYLISGGGNDLVGGNRLAIMTCNPQKEQVRWREGDHSVLMAKGCTERQANLIIAAQRYILPQFYSFLWIMKLQYYLLFDSIRNAPDLKDMAIITQGYDYAIPSPKIRFDASVWYQPLINWALNTGQWMHQPLSIRGILDPLTQRSIIMAMIFEFNEMFIELAQRPEFTHVYHIDSRGAATDEDWFDELHYKPKPYQWVADTYDHCLKDHFARISGQSQQPAQHIYRVKDYVPRRVVS
jgi:hypothetical protein